MNHSQSLRVHPKVAKMSHTPRNLYGNMTNAAADTYYGTLFSHLSYGMGENGNPQQPATTTGPDPTAANATAAAISAAMAAAVSGGEWITSNAATVGGHGDSTFASPLHHHHHHQTTNLLGQQLPTDLNTSNSPLVPPGSVATSSPYAATVLAAVAAAAAAAAATYPQQHHHQQQLNNVSAPGRTFLPNSDYATVYYHRSPVRQPQSQQPGMTASLRSTATTDPYYTNDPSQQYHHPSTGWPYQTSTGMVPMVDGWSTASGGHQQTLLNAPDPNAAMHHLNTQQPGSYTTTHVSGEDGVKEHPTTAFYTPPHLRDPHAMAYAAAGSSSIPEHTTLSYAAPGTVVASGPGVLSTSVGAAGHLINGNGGLVNGQQLTYMDPSYVSMRHAEQQQHVRKQARDEQQERLLDEFGRITVGNSEYGTNDCPSLSLQHHPESSEVRLDGRESLVNPSQWSYRGDESELPTSASGLEHYPRGNQDLVRPGIVQFGNHSNERMHPNATQSTAQVEADMPKPKTWANIAGQPPRGSAAVLVGSTTGWSAKRMPSHVVSMSGPRGPPVSAAVGALKSTARRDEQSHSVYRTESSNGAAASFLPKSSGSASTTLASTTAHANAASYDESVQLMRRESEALYQRLAKSINPSSFDTTVDKARFFVIKSFSEDDIHRSIKYAVWCSTELGNKKLDSAFTAANNQFPIYLFFSVNGSGHFCGMAEMTSRVDYDTRVRVWAQDKWQGAFSVRWIYVKDVPNTALRHIRVETNENKPVTHSRDTTELPLERGRQVMEVFANYSHTLSIFDDFVFYEQRERQDGFRRKDGGTRRG